MNTIKIAHTRLAMQLDIHFPFYDMYIVVGDCFSDEEIRREICFSLPDSKQIELSSIGIHTDQILRLRKCRSISRNGKYLRWKSAEQALR